MRADYRSINESRLCHLRRERSHVLCPLRPLRDPLFAEGIGGPKVERGEVGNHRQRDHRTLFTCSGINSGRYPIASGFGLTGTS
jgi:hypothetical protein